MYFKELITDTDMLKNLTSFGFTKATTIQEKTIPLILEKKILSLKLKQEVEKHSLLVYLSY